MTVKRKNKRQNKRKEKDEFFEEIGERGQLVLLISLSGFFSLFLIPVCIVGFEISNQNNFFLPFFVCLTIYFLFIWYLKIRIISKKKAGVVNFAGAFVAFVACVAGFLFSFC